MTLLQWAKKFGYKQTEKTVKVLSLCTVHPHVDSGERAASAVCNHCSRRFRGQVGGGGGGGRCLREVSERIAMVERCAAYPIGDQQCNLQLAHLPGTCACAWSWSQLLIEVFSNVQ